MPSKNSIEEIYKKKTQREHILLRPDTYIGSIELDECNMWILNENKMENKLIKINKGLYKIFDEILVNAADNSQNDKKAKNINVNITKNEIEVINDGVGIPVVLHKDENCYIPELIFGHFLTGSNFDDKKKRTTGGRNGFGAKLANVFSTHFEVYIEDSKNNKTFLQVYNDNMTKKSEPIIEDKECSKGLVKILFKPDFKKFKMKELTDDMINLFKKRVYDISITTHNKINVYLNDNLINEKNLKSYINLYYDDCEEIIYENYNKEWEFGLVYIPDISFEQITFVNSINTFNGGTHVKYIMDMVIKQLDQYIKKKHKGIKVKPQMIKDHLVLFINSLIDKPQFSSQTKEELTSKVASYGSTCEVSDKIIKKLITFGIVDQIINFIKVKEEMTLKKKTDGKKVNTVRVPKLEDANWAGGKNSSNTFLFVTEGDSAKALAVAGIPVTKGGRDQYGVFPLKGKLLNTREATAKQLLENEEIKNLKKIIGLQQGKIYDEKSINELRYRYIVVFTDQDTDGFHIKGLLMNWIHYEWPSLIKLEFIKALATPIVRAKKKNLVKDFYNEPEYLKWKESVNPKLWHIKYYKGLGTSNSSEAKEYFTDIEKKLINYKWDDEENLTDDSIKLAFEKSKADNRKTWLESSEEKESLNYNEKDVHISKFINCELKLFSYVDLQRSIANIMDGLKPSQRKILYSCFLRNLDKKKDEIKVSQLSGYVSDKTNYHHGEASLQAAIINMAQNYLGSNNINLLHPSGQFGTRIEGGKDHASPRYIFTFLESLTRYIFRKEDECILNYLSDDGIMIEPEYYYPIIPMVLVNGTEGIGTGFSTNIPPFNPEDIIANIKNLMKGKPLKDMVPWYRNFKGKIKMNQNDMTMVGNYDVIDDNTIVINELPIGIWTRNFKDFLQSIEINKDDDKGFITHFRDNNTETDINIMLSFPNKKLELFIKNDTLENKLKLSKTSKKMNNMHLFDKDNNIKKFGTANEILEYFYNERLKAYELRKEKQIIELEKNLEILKNKVKFISCVLNKTIKFVNVKKKDLIENLENLNLPKLSINENLESYDYLIKMDILSFSKEKIIELNEQFENKEKELNILKKTKVIDIWTKELDEFLSKFRKFK